MALSEREATKRAEELLASGTVDNAAVQPAKGGGYEVVTKRPSGPDTGDDSWPSKPAA